MQAIESILSIADRYDTIVFDQWGVLHNGATAYPQAVGTIEALIRDGKELCVLSNSGKRADVNGARITGMGFPKAAFKVVMTSGEALAQDMTARARGMSRLYPITARPGDEEQWGAGIKVEWTRDLTQAEAVLLMGLPDAAEHPREADVLAQALAQALPLICSNPDLASPRANGTTVQSPGALALAYQEAGGKVVFYGKPHRPIFDALFGRVSAQDPARVLMVGDSLHHDIAGAAAVGWHALYIAGGLDAHKSHSAFDPGAVPTYTLPTLR
ncbi:MAG: TIGR01459 family HAD-type hydrolase [Pseudomonadota bacterium]